MKKKLGIVIITLALSGFVVAQNFDFLPIQIVPLHYNPALAGSLKKARLNSMNGIEVQPTIPGRSARYTREGYVNYRYHLSYDQLVDAIRGGIGLSLQYSNLQNRYWNKHFRAAFTYAPKFTIKNKLTISTAFRYRIRRASSKEGNVSPTYANLDAGLLLNTSNSNFGISLKDITAPGKKPIVLNNLPYDVILHGAQQFNFKKYEHTKLTATAIFIMDYALINLNLIAKHKWFLLGGGVGINNHLHFLLGYESKILRITYGHLIEEGPIWSLNRRNSHQISLRYLFNRIDI